MTPHEKTMYYAARYIYRKQGKSTPSGKHTWREWWQERFKQDFDDYVEQMKAGRS